MKIFMPVELVAINSPFPKEVGPCHLKLKTHLSDGSEHTLLHNQKSQFMQADSCTPEELIVGLGPKLVIAENISRPGTAVLG